MRPRASSGNASERAGADELGNLLFHPSPEVLEKVLEDSRLNEEHLLTLLARKNLPRSIVSRMASQREWMSSYSMKLAVVSHPNAPRDVALRLLKFIYVFDLLGVLLKPGTPAELKRLAEQAILSQTGSLTLGQRISLARRGSSRLAARLLGDSEPRVIEAALSNPFLTEQGVASALLLETASAELAAMVASHHRWSVSRVVKLTLVRSRHISLGRVMAILPELFAPELASLAADRRVAPNVRAYAMRLAKARASSKS